MQLVLCSDRVRWNLGTHGGPEDLGHHIKTGKTVYTIDSSDSLSLASSAVEKETIRLVLVGMTLECGESLLVEFLLVSHTDPIQVSSLPDNWFIIRVRH